MCSLTHNGKNLFKPVQSKRVGTYKSFFYHVKWDELWVISIYLKCTFKCYCVVCTVPPCWHCRHLSQDQLPHSSCCPPTGVHTNPDSVRGAEPECRRLPRLQQAEEISRAAGKSLDAALWLQTVREEQYLPVTHNFTSAACFIHSHYLIKVNYWKVMKLLHRSQHMKKR